MESKSPGKTKKSCQVGLMWAEAAVESVLQERHLQEQVRGGGGRARGEACQDAGGFDRKVSLVPV